jgi:hypothetical protein
MLVMCGVGVESGGAVVMVDQAPRARGVGKNPQKCALQRTIS